MKKVVLEVLKSTERKNKGMCVECGYRFGAHLKEKIKR
jgi:hypothetical protein